MRTKRVYKPLSPEKQAKKNAALLEKRRAAGVKPKKKNLLTADQMREKHRNYMAAYRERNKERIKERRMERREELALKGRIRYANNKESCFVSIKKWKQKNTDKVRIMVQNYRAKKRANSGVVSRDIVARLMKMQRGMCIACRADISKQFHIDHINPISAGGDHSDNNIQLLCPSCNMSKQAQHPIEFMQKKGFLL